MYLMHVGVCLYKALCLFLDFELKNVTICNLTANNMAKGVLQTNAFISDCFYFMSMAYS